MLEEFFQNYSYDLYCYEFSGCFSIFLINILFFKLFKNIISSYQENINDAYIEYPDLYLKSAYLEEYGEADEDIIKKE